MYIYIYIYKERERDTYYISREFREPGIVRPSAQISHGFVASANLRDTCRCIIKLRYLRDPRFTRFVGDLRFTVFIGDNIYIYIYIYVFIGLGV